VTQREARHGRAQQIEVDDLRQLTSVCRRVEHDLHRCDNCVRDVLLHAACAVFFLARRHFEGERADAFDIE
jgi:hypothetical protein